MPPVFFILEPLSGVIVLSEEESAHAVRVLRLTSGDEILLTDGCGGRCKAVIEQPHAKRCVVSVTEICPREDPPCRLHIAIAPTKQIDRTEWFVEKATELGITDITPLLCEHAERKMIHVDRLMRVALAAVKQSQRAWMPAVHPLTSLKEFLQEPRNGLKGIAYCGDIPKRPLFSVYQAGQEATLLIGPEGDFSPEEVREAMQHQFIPITLGNMRLRTETAALAACHSIVLLNAMHPSV